jgi:hypothetical protein
MIAGFAPLSRGDASGLFASWGVGFAKIKTPRSPSAHDPLVRGSMQ